LLKRIDSLIGKCIAKFELEKDKVFFETTEGEKLEILASDFRSPSGWKLSNYLNDMDDFHVKMALKNDLINHHNVRIKTIV